MGRRISFTDAELQIIRDAMVRHRIWLINYDDTPEEDWEPNLEDTRIVDRITRKVR